jgi:hypothetical protein
MNASTRLFLLLGILLALGACSSREAGPNDTISVAPSDTDATFLRAMLLDEVSTRESPKNSARFILSDNRDSSSKYTAARTSEIIDSVSGCKFSISYTPRMALNSTALSSIILGAPGADQTVFSSEANAFSLSAPGAACARVAMRPDLARARDLAAAGARFQAVNQAFASALPEIGSAIALGAKNPAGSRFALTEANAVPKSESTEYTLIERSTGCQWKTRKSGAGLLALASIEPDACNLAISMAFIESMPAGKPMASTSAAAR